MSKIDLEDLVGQLRLIIEESDMDYKEAKALGRIFNELIKDNNDKNELNKKYDKIMKVNMFLLEKYREDLFKEFEIKDENDFVSIVKMFDKMYEIENKKYPLMWYEYGISKI